MTAINAKWVIVHLVYTVQCTHGRNLIGFGQQGYRGAGFQRCAGRGWKFAGRGGAGRKWKSAGRGWAGRKWKSAGWGKKARKSIDPKIWQKWVNFYWDIWSVLRCFIEERSLRQKRNKSESVLRGRFNFSAGETKNIFRWKYQIKMMPEFEQ